MRLSKILLSIIFPATIIGGTLANNLVKGPIKVYYKTTANGPCDHIRLVRAAAITSEELGVGYSSYSSATIADTQPATCTLTVYYLPEVP